MTFSINTVAEGKVFCDNIIEVINSSNRKEFTIFYNNKIIVFKFSAEISNI